MFSGERHIPVLFPAAFVLLSVFLSFCAQVSAQQNPDQLLSRAEKALGSKKAVKRITSLRKRGLIVRASDGASGEIVMQTAKPDSFNLFYEIQGFEHEMGFNGRSGWLRDSRNGLKTLTGDLSRDLKAEALFRNWRWTEYKKQKLQITASESLVMDGKPTVSVTLTNPRGVPVKLFFNAFNYLLLREEFHFGDRFVAYDYSDYRPVDGVLEAFEITAYDNGERYLYKFDQVAHNVRIPGSEFDFPRADGRPLPDISKFVSEIRHNQEEVERILEDYSYKQDIVKRKLNDDGRVEIKDSETFQLSFHKGYRIQRLIGRDGKPLSPEDQEKADEDARKQVEKIEKKLAKEAAQEDEGDSGREGEGFRISIAEVLSASKLLNPRRERLKGRNVIVFDFEPDPDFDFDNAKSFLRLFGKAAGVMWVDEKDRQVVRVEAFLFDSVKVGGGILAKLRKGATFTLEQDKINDEIWLPTFADINFSVRVLLFGGVKVNQLVRSYDFRKFETKVEDARINEIPDQ